MKIIGERIKPKNENENWLMNEGSRSVSPDETKKTYDFWRSNDIEGTSLEEKYKNKSEEELRKELESFISIDSNINNGKISDEILKNTPITSKVDGKISYTNVQDSNLSGLSAKDAWSEFGKISGNAATNFLGISNSQLSNLVGIFGDNPATEFDKRMTKLNKLKEEKFKDLHPFDWKPGQTIPKDLMKSSLASMTEDIVNSVDSIFGTNGKNIFKKVEDAISPDPVKYARDSMKRSKGIYSTIDGDQSEISMKSDNFVNSYTMASGSNSVSSIWQKEKKQFSPFNKSKDELKIINALKNKNSFNKTLGYIYIRPSIKYDNQYQTLNSKEKDGTGEFQIPFEFNPEISEGDYQANYVSETLLNRIGQFQIYTGTNLSQLNINLKYMALSPDYIDEETKDSMGKQFSTDAWQYYWTNNRIEAIEYKLRSLVFPDMVSRDYLVKPPIIEVHVGSELGMGSENVGDLYKYPIDIEGSNTENDKKYLDTTRTVKNGKVNRYKKYIVTSVQIDNLNDDSFIWPSLYGRVLDKSKSGSPINHIKTGSDLKETTNTDEFGFSGYTRRTGFKASLRCIEVTENFLDLVPDFKSYYDAWTLKEGLSNDILKYSQNILGSEEINKTTKFLEDEAVITVRNSKSNIEEILNNHFEKAYIKANLYNNFEKRDDLKAYDLALKTESKVEDKFYFANSLWNEEFRECLSNKDNAEDGKTSTASIASSDPITQSVDQKNEDEKEYTEPLNGPVLFNVELDNCFKGFLKQLIDLNEIDGIYNHPGRLPHVGDENIAMPKDDNKLSKVVEIKNFYGTGDEDILEIYKEGGMMNNLCNRSNNNSYFTDKEAFFMLEKIIGLCEDLGERINTIQNTIIIEPENVIITIKNLYKIVINTYRNIIASGVNNWDFENLIFNYPENNRCYAILKEKLDYDIFRYLFTTDILYLNQSVILGIDRMASYDCYEMIQYLNKAFDENYEDTHAGSSIAWSEKVPANVITYVENNKMLKLLEEDIKDDGKEEAGKNFFKKLEKMIKENPHAPDWIPWSLHQKEKRYRYCLMSILESIKFCSDFVNAQQSYELSSVEAGKYLIKSANVGDWSGNNVKCLHKSKKTLVCYVYDSHDSEKTNIPQDPDRPKGNHLGDKLKVGEQEVDIFKLNTMPTDDGIYILSAKYIKKQITEASEKAIEELNDLKKVVETIDPTYERYFDDLKKIKYDYDFNYDDDSNFKKFKENQQRLILIIKSIKQSLNKEVIQEQFNRIAGSYKDIKGLEPLKKESENYSSSKKYLRRNVFKSWDECYGLGSTNELVDEGVDFTEKFKDMDNGVIPYDYYTKYNNDELEAKFQVASDDIRSYEKLS